MWQHSHKPQQQQSLTLFQQITNCASLGFFPAVIPSEVCPFRGLLFCHSSVIFLVTSACYLSWKTWYSNAWCTWFMTYATRHCQGRGKKQTDFHKCSFPTTVCSNQFHPPTRGTGLSHWEQISRHFPMNVSNWAEELACGKGHAIPRWEMGGKTARVSSVEPSVVFNCSVRRAKLTFLKLLSTSVPSHTSTLYF